MKMLRTLLIFFGLALTSVFSLNAQAACTEGQLLQCYSGGVGGLQICSGGVLGPCTVPPSMCKGTKPSASLLSAAADDGSGALMGLMCGSGSGANQQCYSCAAQWIYPSKTPRAGGQVECRCL